MPRPPVTFGLFTFEPERMSLTREGEPLHLGGRATSLLATLIDADGDVVSKERLIEAAWPDAIVEEGNLSVQIAALRKVLGRRTDGNEWVTTVPRIGYRLARRASPVANQSRRGKPSIAVLPFANISGSPDEEYFADGVVDDLIRALSRFKSISVISRNSSFAYKGQVVDVRSVAATLGVSYVVEGSVRRAAGQLRLGAQLVDGIDGAHLWAESFDGVIEDVFDMQDTITRCVAMLIEPRVQQAELEHSRRDRPGSLAVYDLYLRALQKVWTMRSDDNIAAVQLLDAAIALDPTYAIALSTNAWALQHRAGMGWPDATPNDRQRGLDLARAALALGRDDALVLTHCGRVLQVLGGEYELGLKILERAVSMNPDNSLAVLDTGIGHLWGGSLDEALRYLRRVVRPGLSEASVAMTAIAHVEICLSNYEEAVGWATRSMAENPDFDATHWMLIAANAHLGRAEEAKRALNTYLSIAPNASLLSVRRAQHFKDRARVDVLIAGLALAGMAES